MRCCEVVRVGDVPERLLEHEADSRPQRPPGVLILEHREHALPGPELVGHAAVVGEVVQRAERLLGHRAEVQRAGAPGGALQRADRDAPQPRPRRAGAGQRPHQAVAAVELAGDRRRAASAGRGRARRSRRCGRTARAMSSHEAKLRSAWWSTMASLANVKCSPRSARRYASSTSSARRNASSKPPASTQVAAGDRRVGRVELPRRRLPVAALHRRVLLVEHVLLPAHPRRQDLVGRRDHRPDDDRVVAAARRRGGGGGRRAGRAPGRRRRR